MVVTGCQTHFTYNGPHATHFDLWAGRTSKNPISVSAKKFICTFKPCDRSVGENQVQFQQHVSQFYYMRKKLCFIKWAWLFGLKLYLKKHPCFISHITMGDRNNGMFTGPLASVGFSLTCKRSSQLISVYILIWTILTQMPFLNTPRDSRLLLVSNWGSFAWTQDGIELCVYSFSEAHKWRLSLIVIFCSDNKLTLL